MVTCVDVINWMCHNPWLHAVFIGCSITLLPHHLLSASHGIQQCDRSESLIAKTKIIFQSVPNGVLRMCVVAQETACCALSLNHCAMLFALRWIWLILKSQMMQHLAQTVNSSRACDIFGCYFACCVVTLCYCSMIPTQAFVLYTCATLFFSYKSSIHVPLPCALSSCRWIHPSNFLLESRGQIGRFHRTNTSALQNKCFKTIRMSWVDV